MRIGVLPALLALACGPALDVGRDAAARPDARAPDAGPPPDAELTPDAAPSPDAAAPRRLTTRALLGALPIENRWMDPMMELSTSHWAIDVIDGTATPFERFDRMRREVHSDAPSGAPVLHVRRGRDGRVVLLTEGIGVGAPMSAKVWIGRRIDFGGDLPIVRLLGTSSTGASSSAMLTVTATVVARTSGVEWTLREGRWDAAPLGQVLMQIEDPVAAAELFVTGPELVAR